MSLAIRAIAGLGNPGEDYLNTRHNAGFWFLDLIEEQNALSWKLEKKLHAKISNYQTNGQTIRLFKPTTFMNNSGKSMVACNKYYNIALGNLLVAHDDIDLEIGQIKIKLGGGHGGHNGLRDIINALGGRKDFYRLRIGVGRPKHSSQVHDYVLKPPSKAEQSVILQRLQDALATLPDIISGEFEKAMRELHGGN